MRMREHVLNAGGDDIAGALFREAMLSASAVVTCDTAAGQRKEAGGAGGTRDGLPAAAVRRQLQRRERAATTRGRKCIDEWCWRCSDGGNNWACHGHPTTEKLCGKRTQLVGKATSLS